MTELGSKPLGGTLLDGAAESKHYPRIHLSDSETDAVGDHEVGHEVTGTVRVRVSEIGKAADGSRSASLEVLDLTLEEMDKPTAADRMYPSVVGE